MKDQGKLITGVVVGASAMYLLDPDRGAGRRALLREQGAQVGHKLGDGLGATARDARSRTRSTAAALRARFKSEASDEEVEHAGERARTGRLDLLQDSWAPATRLLVGIAGGVLLAQGIRSRGIIGRSLSAVGIGLVTRAVSHSSPRQLLKLATAAWRGISVEKTITVGVPVEQVWELWNNFENFPRFMTHLQEVRKIDEGRSHWVAAGPAGMPVEWDALVTDWVPQQFIGWTSAEGSSVETTGQVRFRPISSESTEIDVRMEYHPPAGVAGHAIASLFGTDPKRAMDEDLVRLKIMLEDGTTRAAADEVRGDEPTGQGGSGGAKKRAARRRRKS